MATWISDDVQSFVDCIRDLKSRGLATSWSEEEIVERAAELPRELSEALSSAALFEVLVENHIGQFDPYQIHERHTTQVAWEPAYLSDDGEKAIAENVSELGESKAFRVAFYVHEWPEGGELVGPAGTLAHPPLTWVPERLWKLAPYELLD
jgi:hypothetical protein